MPEIELAAGFRIRALEASELEIFNRLRAGISWPEWDPGQWEKFRKKALPGGVLAAEECAAGRPAASACAESTDFPEYPNLGVLGWVLCDPEFSGRRLGRSVSVAAMHVLRAAGYRKFSLLTDDFRTAALKTYLRLGWRPWLWAEDMEARWRAVAAALAMNYEDLRPLTDPGV